MTRLSIDITPEQHKKLKAIAALRGQSIKDYVLARTLSDVPDLPGSGEAEALAALADFLKPRLEQAGRGEFSTRSIEEIRQSARKQAGV